MPERVLRAFAASLDPATGLYDGHTIRLRMVEELTRARRYGYPVSLIVVTLPSPDAKYTEDHVRQLAELLERHVRTADILARCEHDTLLLVLPHTDAEGARRLGERVYQMATVMQLPAGLGGRPAPVHVGITTVPANHDAEIAAVAEMLWEKLCGVASANRARFAVVPLS